MNPPTDHTAWFDRVHPYLRGQGLWLRGDEPGRMDPADYGNAALRVLVVRLSTYDDVAESFTHRLLYQVARQVRDVFVDLAFLPPRDDARVFDRDGVPWLLGTATKTGPSGFDVVALSNSIVQELVSLPTVLGRSGIPLDGKDRLADPQAPLVILGGANAIATPALWHDAAPVDGIFVGESVVDIGRIFACCRESKIAGLPKERTLDALVQIPGFFRPHGAASVRRPPVTAPDESNDLLAGAPQTYAKGQPGRATLQLSEGCPCFCTFCSESWMRKPYREATPARLLSTAHRLKQEAGLSRIDLYSFNFNIHRDFYNITGELAEIFPAIGLKSQRFDLLAQDAAMMPWLHALGKTSVTCGLEGISARLRRYLRKSLDESVLRRSLVTILSSPLRELKVFLIATGREEVADEEEFRGLVNFIRDECGRSVRNPRIIFSVTPLVRFPATPLEGEDAPEPETVASIAGRIGAIVKQARFEFREAMGAQEYWVSQILVRARDPRVWNALTDAVSESGFVYYSGIPSRLAAVFRRNLIRTGVDPASLLKGTAPGEALPWAGIETGVHRRFLSEAAEKSTRFVDEGYCLGTCRGKGVCQGCGACADEDRRSALTRERARQAPQLEGLRDRMRGLRESERDVAVLMDVSERARGVPRATVAAMLARAIMIAAPELVAGYAGFRRSLWEEHPWTTGGDLFVLAWRGDGASRLDVLGRDPGFVARVNAGLGSWGALQGVGQDAGPGARRFAVTSPFCPDVGAYAARVRLKHTMRKTVDGGMVAELTPESVRKGIISSLELRESPPGSWTVRLAAGVKFDPTFFAQTAFVLPAPQEWVRVRVLCSLDLGARAGAAPTSDSFTPGKGKPK